MLDPGKPSFTPKKGKPSVVMFVGLQGQSSCRYVMSHAMVAAHLLEWRLPIWLGFDLLLLLWKVQSFTSLLSYIGKIRFFIPKVKPNLILYQHACWKYLQYNTMFCKRSYSWHLFTYPCIVKLTNHKAIASDMNILESILPAMRSTWWLFSKSVQGKETLIWTLISWPVFMLPYFLSYFCS